MESFKKGRRLLEKISVNFSLPSVNSATSINLIGRLDQYEYAWCKRATQWAVQSNAQAYFDLVSRLGNGIAWYLIIFSLPLLFGTSGFIIAIAMTLTGAVNAFGYTVLKHRIRRERPFITFSELYCGTPPLDRFSFPSGHTLHATTFALITCFFFPIMALLMLPLTLSIALSRVVLGLHYPSDVAAASIMGIITATVAIVVTAQVFV